MTPLQIEERKRILSKISRESALSRMQILSRIPDFKIEEDLEKEFVRSHWMTFILLAGRDIRITYKVHFTSADARTLASKIYDDQNVSIEKCIDFFKEFCNLSMGGIKASLEQNDILVGASLPLVTRGFDALLFPPLVGKESFEDTWNLVGEGLKIGCSASYEIFQSFTIDENRLTTGLTDSEPEFF